MCVFMQQLFLWYIGTNINSIYPSIDTHRMQFYDAQYVPVYQHWGTSEYLVFKNDEY